MTGSDSYTMTMEAETARVAVAVQGSDVTGSELERRALRTLARRAMEQYVNGNCFTSEQAMAHFRNLAQ